jgi:hypothetical protein
MESFDQTRRPARETSAAKSHYLKIFPGASFVQNIEKPPPGLFTVWFAVSLSLRQAPCGNKIQRPITLEAVLEDTKRGAADLLSKRQTMNS